MKYNQLQFKCEQSKRSFLWLLRQRLHWSIDPGRYFKEDNSFSYQFLWKNFRYEVPSNLIFWFILEFGNNSGISIDKIDKYNTDFKSETLKKSLCYVGKNEGYPLMNASFLADNRSSIKRYLTADSYRNLLKFIHPSKYENVEYVFPSNKV